VIWASCGHIELAKNPSVSKVMSNELLANLAKTHSLEDLMTKDDVKTTSVSMAVSEAKAAFAAGQLNDYSAMSASGAGVVTATIATSWGPAMRR
jgi:hypothetical protein